MTGKKRDVWQSSEYFNELGKKDKIRYKEKPSLSDGTTGYRSLWTLKYLEKRCVAIARYIMGRHIPLPY